MPVPVTFGPYHFPSKLKAKEFIHEILYNYERLDVVGKADSHVLHELIKLHPHAEEKIGCGIQYFYVDSNDRFNSIGFHIKRKDGSSEVFSYHKCLGTK